jgi:RNA polymerase sigma-70 factor, ECF subfamily
LGSPVDENTGKLLLQRIADKDRKAFEEFYYLYAEGIGRFLMKMLKRPEWVDEAVNDVMLTIWQSAGNYDPERGRLSTWLFGIAHNKGIKTLERYGRHREESLDELPDMFGSDVEADTDAFALDSTSSVSSPEKTVMAWELGDALSWAIERLSPDHQTVIELCFSEDFTYQEIADIMGCPINTVKTRLFHARKKLSDMLTRKGFTVSEEVTISL